MLNPVHLRTLVVVIRTGSFADAARQLGYTGSAVSQQIAALERAVRVPLFERSAHSVRATPAAQFLARRAHDSLTSLQALEDEVAGMVAGGAGSIRIGSFPTASERLLPRALARLHEERPAVEVLLDEGETDELLPALGDGAIDLALVYRYDLVPRSWPRGLGVEPLLREDLVLLLPSDHPRAAGEPPRLAELGDERWISPREATAGAVCLRRLCAGAGFQPRVAVRSNDYDVVSAFVRAGLGIALVPALSHDPREGVVAARVADVTAHRHVAAVHRSLRHNPAVAGALDALRSSAHLLAGGLPGVDLPEAPGRRAAAREEPVRR
ncbi:MAG TPA: LysR family transcriptional regulator [Segeticoccus sp.]|nr:LysR family transcriptional regulator [Segeticoccus sp.]